MCLSYIAGALDMLALQAEIAPGSTGVCLPPTGLSVPFAVEAYLQYAAKNGTPSGLSASPLLHAALLELYPCR